MKMIPGSGTISNYSSYTSNCTLGQFPYTIPLNALTDVQLYINIGSVKPSYIQIELIHTCGPLAGAVYNLTTSDYVIGQNKSNQWYGVFKNLVEVDPVPLTCFVIAISLTFAGSGSDIYFSEEYCVDNPCQDLTLVKGCYGNLDALLSTDCEGIYFGVHAGSGTPLGDTSVKYEHQALMRGVEVTLNAIKNSFKQGRTRNFRTEKEKIFQFWSETIPEWYLSEIDAIFYRGEVFIGSTKYLLNETQFEKIEDCFKQWKPWATFKESCYQSFSCEADPCAIPDGECCDPVVTSVTVTEIFEESGGSGGIIPPPTNFDDIVVVECFVDDTPIVSGTTDPVTGLTNGSSVVTCDAFDNLRVEVSRGGFVIPGEVTPDGSNYYTKVLTNNFITFSSPLVNDEFIRIQTIP